MKKIVLYIPGLDSDGVRKTRILAASGIFDEVLNLRYPLPVPAAVEALDRRIRMEVKNREDDEIFLAGSSMGGFFADCFSEKYNLPSILLNPLVDPDDLRPLIGQSSITEPDIEALKRVRPDRLAGHAKLIMLETGDELLNWEKARDEYRNRGLVIRIDGGDHRFSDFEAHLDHVREFAKGFFI